MTIATTTRRIRPTSLVAAATLAVTLLAVLAPVSRASTAGDDYVYVANRYGPWSAAIPLAAGVVEEETGVRTAPEGTVQFRPDGTSFTVSVDDAVNRVESIPLTVAQFRSGAWHVRDICVPVGTPTTVTGIDSQRTVGIVVWDTVSTRWSQVCPGSLGGTVGTLTVVP